MSGDPHATSAEARVADAAAERRRLRAVHEQSSRQTSMRDVLTGLAERTAEVSLVMRSGRTHRARVSGVNDAVVVANIERGATLVAGAAAVVAVVTHREHAAARGGGYGAGDDRTMSDILAERAAARPRITAWVGAETVTGTLIAVGEDVATISLDSSGAACYVRLDSTTEMSVSASSSV